jgi:hypothetical protein
MEDLEGLVAFTPSIGVGVQSAFCLACYEWGSELTAPQPPSHLQKPNYWYLRSYTYYFNYSMLIYVLGTLLVLHLLI